MSFKGSYVEVWGRAQESLFVTEDPWNSDIGEP